MNAHPSSRLEQVEELQNLMIARACGEYADSATYARLRRELLNDPQIAPRLPPFVRTCGDVGQFWQFIKYQLGRYAERRNFIWESFRPLLSHLEGANAVPADDPVTLALQAFDRKHVSAVWAKEIGRAHV